jgi:hypothetical protein
LILADNPSRERLRELRARLAVLRDAIAELDVEIEALRAELAAFEQRYHAALAPEHMLLRRAERLIRHLERWSQMLGEAPGEEVTVRAERLERKRARELEEQAREQPIANHDTPEPLPASRQNELKAIYRALARRYHPDLGRSEEECLRFGQLMAQINELYRLGDAGRLQAMLDQAQADVAPDALDDEAQIELLEKRVLGFESVLANLQSERVALEQCATCELWRDVEQARVQGRDLIEEVRAQLLSRIDAASSDIGRAIHRLEECVNQFNASGLTRATQGVVRFDPHVDKGLVRLGLQALAELRTSPEAERFADWIVQLAEPHPALLRVIMLTYVAELAPFPLPGLESYDDVELRFASLQRPGEPALSVEQALLQLDEVLEFGVKRASERHVRAGLRFRSVAAHDAMPLVLRRLDIRREFRRLLLVLGEREHCATCEREIFSIPLFRLRGLDDLRALVCPHCATTLRSYWMPRGKDVQGVLNSAFLDFEIVTESVVTLGRGSVALQLLPEEWETMCARELKQRIYADIFRRNDMALTLEQLALEQNGEAIADEVALADLDARDFTLRLREGAPLGEADTLELLKHRIRTRWE